jgi:hypothetical protein
LIKGWLSGGCGSRFDHFSRPGAIRRQAKLLNVADFLKEQEDLPQHVLHTLAKEARKLNKAAARAKNRTTSEDIDESIMLDYLNDAIAVVEVDGPTVASHLRLAIAEEDRRGRVTPGGKATPAYYAARRALPLPEFKSSALAGLDPRVGFGLRNILHIIEGAATLVVAMLSVMRQSEILRMSTKSVSPDVNAGAELSENFKIISGRLSKVDRPHEWIAAPAVDRAVSLLEEIGRPIRHEIGVDALFVLQLFKGRIVARAQKRRRTPRVISYVSIRRRVRIFAAACKPDQDASKLQFRMLRRFMAKFIARRDRSSLGALAYQYGHLETRVTEASYVGKDRELSRLISSAQAEEVAGAMDDLVNAESIYSNLPADVLSQSVERMSGVLQRASTVTEVMKMLASGVVLGPCDWGYCFYRESRSRCEGDSAGPNPAKRTPSTCVGCLNFTATAKHFTWWGQRRDDLVEFLKLRGLPEQSRLVAEERLAAAEAVLKKLGRRV